VEARGGTWQPRVSELADKQILLGVRGSLDAPNFSRSGLEGGACCSGKGIGGLIGSDINCRMSWQRAGDRSWVGAGGSIGS
jgi:hypothetical protein